ncbi:MAG: CoB--CoM heterodisulfide reductase iron-sulfur subunit B family protein [Dehalococcoidia bacterium]|jgi:succinate dehydrogenase / fumarate reductase cytochrome b subunit|nr:heterodisulfide reductase [Chloroflexota bacterium]MCH2495172.1 CoB--CoM heterodisulfide reductase iron-sulfur subunit B family protein [Dehalococcoidia bacterium]MQF83325.1 heterodisulfide reductase [SAR202 cluster bacterium]MEC9098889.1 CoB--CoM heterodisulfide reductase iron-sulfur subunit B family protein [Chloroflexota bacterium]MED5254876.1 CoB--CoM heterodisulfide reductase iron-sulfur subunit B family protein [Chloroflexota bacterium]|tara:strand:+ start:2662 stop:3531 length:870 start_codon:yes stop_codon:yes gene_type:complete
MKFAFYPGCVARGGTPELLSSSMAVLKALDIEVEELTKAGCTGAGVLQEKNPLLGDTINVRTLAMAEEKKLNIMTLCSTCQGVLSQANHKVKSDPKYLDQINDILKDEGYKYNGTTEVKHLLWILVEDYGLENIEVTKPLSNLKFAPFYGCYMVRPSEALGFDERPERQEYLEKVIEAVGAVAIDFPGKFSCCGFPVLFINQKNSLKMVSNQTGSAKDLGADAMVTPCPLCHLNLDGYQGKARSNNRGDKADLPIIHMPQMIALAMGLETKDIGLGRHIVSTKEILNKV